jgi:hypothetical protein
LQFGKEVLLWQGGDCKRENFSLVMTLARAYFGGTAPATTNYAYGPHI